VAELRGHRAHLVSGAGEPMPAEDCRRVG
jgi:hypothetical protein